MQRLIVMFVVLGLAASASAQIAFEKVESRTGYGSVREGDDGILTVDDEWIRFTDDDAREFLIPTASVSSLYYARVSGRRLKTALLVSPMFFFSKGRKHYVTLAFDGGAVDLKLDKNNYRSVLRTLEQVTGLTVLYEQEGIKDTEQDIATRELADNATVEIVSSPVDAEVEIDGAFNGTTPRIKSLEPGEYTVRVHKPGYTMWERTLSVMSGDNVRVHADLVSENP